MVKTLYVGNLPYTTSESSLRELFEAHGEVTSVKIITDRETGRSRGFGFVEIDSEAADKAIDALNGYSLEGRTLRVNEAKSKTSRNRR